MDTDDALAAYEKWLRSWDASERTIDARLTLLRGRLREWGGVPGLTQDNLETFLSNPNLSKWSKATYHGHFKSFCDWATAAGLLAESPMAGVRKVRPPGGLPRPLAEADVARVLAVVQGEVRDWIMLALLAGLRVSEIAKMRGEDVQQDGLYVEGKGGTKVTLPCHPDLWAMAQRYPRRGYWFPGPDGGHVRSQRISLVVGKVFYGLGIDGSIHRCRHTYATRLLRAGVHVRKVQKLMRHANLETTANYTAVDEDELRDAIMLLPTTEPHPPAA